MMWDAINRFTSGGNGLCNPCWLLPSLPAAQSARSHTLAQVSMLQYAQIHESNLPYFFLLLSNQNGIAMHASN